MKVFISYTRTKDEFAAVSDFVRHFSNELNLLDPESTVFYDKKGLEAGDVYPEDLENELDNSDLLVILVSPAWLSRAWCRREYEHFAAKEHKRRVVPILWVTTPQLNTHADDAIARGLAPIVYDDWRDLRHKKWDDEVIRTRVAKLAERVVSLVT
jgi:hypothetical protein